MFQLETFDHKQLLWLAYQPETTVTSVVVLVCFLCFVAYCFLYVAVVVDIVVSKPGPHHSCLICQMSFFDHNG